MCLYTFKNREVVMIPEYADEELMLFINGYSGMRHLTLNRLKSYATKGSGVLSDVLNIPFDELPLHINNRLELHKGAVEWYKACVSVRLKIGR